MHVHSLLAAAPVFLVSFYKPLLLFVTFVPWAWLVSSKLEKDARALKLKYRQWNLIYMGAAAAAFAADIEKTAAGDPAALLGFLYVMEGSTLGASMLRGPVATAYGLEEKGLAYYTPYGRRPGPHWKAFRQRMNAAPLDTGQQQRVVDAAKLAFRRVGAMLCALYE